MRSKSQGFWLMIGSEPSLLSSAPVREGFIAYVVSPASKAIVISLLTAACNQIFHCGLKWSAAFFAIHDAKPSSSQELSRGVVVTRWPNHWCAILSATAKKILCLTDS